MVGLLLWKKREKGVRPISVEECTMLHMRFLRAEVAKEGDTPEWLVRRRVSVALGRLRKQGVTCVVLPEDFPYRELLGKQGLRPFSTLGLRRAVAADWVRGELAARQLPIGSARVAVSAELLTGEVVRTVRELVLHHRYVLLDLPRGGEDLCRQLRREYGVAVQLAPSLEQLREAEARVLFDGEKHCENPVCLRLWDESQPLPPLVLPLALEEQIPPGMERGQLLAALREAGVLRPGQITVDLPILKDA